MLRAGRPFHSVRHDRVRVIQPEDAGLDYASARPERGAFDVSWRCCGAPGRCFFASSNPVKEPVGTRRMFFFISCNRHREQLQCRSLCQPFCRMNGCRPTARHERATDEVKEITAKMRLFANRTFRDGRPALA